MRDLIAEWERDYGEDSDWFRARVLGLSPAAEKLQYIDSVRIQAARQRVGRFGNSCSFQASSRSRRSLNTGAELVRHDWSHASAASSLAWCSTA
jgi:hypothetical protein